MRQLFAVPLFILLCTSPSMAQVDSFPYAEGFESGFGIWTDSPSNDFDWARQTGQTPSSGTGPNAARDGDWYIYTEASGNNPSETAAIEAVFDFSALSSPALTLYYHMYGSSMGDLHVDVCDDGTWTSNVWELAGQQQASNAQEWAQAEIDLSAYAGSSNLTLRIRGVTGASYTSDMSVDKIRLFDDVPRVDVDPLSQTGFQAPGRNINYTVTVINETGGDANFDVFYFNDPWSTIGPVQSGVMTNGQDMDFLIQVQVPSGAYAGDASTSTVQYVSLDNAFTGTLSIVTHCSWTTWPMECETWDIFPNGWTNYAFGSTVFPWLQSGIGNPAPGLYHPAYTAMFTNWFVSPGINLTDTFPDTLELVFDDMVIIQDGYDYTGVFISSGSRNPADGDFVELLELGGGSTSWTEHQIDLTSYQGSNPVYIAFEYIGSNSHLPFIDNVCIQGTKLGVDNSIFISPTSVVAECGQVGPTFTGNLYIDGVTGSSGPAERITAQVGFGEPGTSPETSTDWFWYPMAYTGTNGLNDVFAAAPLIDVAGTLDVALRFTVGAAGWVYADLDGSTNGYDPAMAGVLESTLSPLPGEIIYDQTMDAYGWFSSVLYSNSSPADPVISADDFIMPVETHINALRWRGVYDLSSLRQDALGFTVQIYENEGSNAVTAFDHPGIVVYSEYREGHACQSLSTNLYGTDHFMYQLQLATTFEAQPVTKYWFSVQRVGTDNDFEWYLLNTEDPESGSPACQYNDGAWYEMYSDLGFELYGSYTNNGTLSGTVTALHSGDPVGGAVIGVVGSSNMWTTSESDGTYVLHLPLGTHDIYAEAKYYQTNHAGSITFSISGQTEQQNFSLSGSRLYYDPSPIEQVVLPDAVVTNTVTVTNTGPVDVVYHLGITDYTRPSTTVSTGTPLPVLAYGIETDNENLFSFSTDNPLTHTNIGDTGADNIWASDFLPDDVSTLYAITDENEFIAITVSNAAVTVLGRSVPSPGQDWTGLAGDVDGTLYACSTDIDVSELYIIDLNDGTPTLIGAISNSPATIAIAINAGGELYGHDIVNDSLISINKSTGAGTIIGPLGFSASFGQGMDFDYETGILYLSAFDQSAGPQLRTADLATGATTLIGDFSVNQVGTMAIPTTNGATWASLSTPGGSIVSGGVGTFDVIFDAGMVTNNGTYTANVYFRGNVVNVVPPLPLLMHVADGPVISAPTEIDFGGIYLNTTSTLPLTVKNTGFGSVTGQLENIAVPFSLIGGSEYLLAPLESVDLTIALSSSVAGTFTNAVNLTGTGGQEVLLKGHTLPTLKVIPVAVMFANTRIGSYNEAIVLSQNIGDGVLTGSVSSLSLPYTLTGSTNFTLSSMEWAFHVVRFEPTAEGIFIDTLEFFGGGGAQIPIMGVGIPWLTPDIFDAEQVTPGQMRLEWIDDPGMIYKVWWTDNLMLWPTSQYYETTGSVWTETNPAVSIIFYRLSGE